MPFGSVRVLHIPLCARVFLLALVRLRGCVLARLLSLFVCLFVAYLLVCLLVCLLACLLDCLTDGDWLVD